MVPRAGAGVVLFITEGEIGALGQAGFGAEQRGAVDLAAVGRDMLFKPPAQATEEIQLAVFGVVLVQRIGAAKRVIPGPVKVGAVERYGVGEGVQVIGI